MINGRQPVSPRTDGPLGRGVYLDHHATTPVDPRVAKLVFETMTESFGNAHSIDHAHGQAAAALVENAASQVAELTGAAPKSVRFTSGATESIRMAIACASADRECLRVALPRVEHKAILDSVRSLVRQGRAKVHWIEVDHKARVSIDEIKTTLAKGVDLLCLMAANNEVGTIYPVEAAASLALNSGSEILVDATPAVGRVPMAADDWGVDYLVLSAHKLYGPKGVGALIGPSARTPAFDDAAGHAGTLNVPGIVGFGEACRIAKSEGDEAEAHARRLRDHLEVKLLEYVPGLAINGDSKNRLGNNLHVSAPGTLNDAVLARLQGAVAISTGAACSSGAQEPSHVLRAMGLSSELQEGALRISTGKFNTQAEIDYAADEIAAAIAAVRAAVGTLK
jgi:cysteine desulfurase